MDSTVIELGLVGIALVVMWRLLDMMKLWWMVRNGKSGDGAVYMTKLQCMTDPSHFERIKRIEKQQDWIFNYDKANEPALKRIREGIPKGEFGCTWKDRDEVLKMINVIADNTKAQQYVEVAQKETVTALRELTAEIRKQNGRQ